MLAGMFISKDLENVIVKFNEFYEWSARMHAVCEEYTKRRHTTEYAGVVWLDPWMYVNWRSNQNLGGARYIYSFVQNIRPNPSLPKCYFYSAGDQS